jgi:hypothetical protein
MSTKVRATVEALHHVPEEGRAEIEWGASSLYADGKFILLDEDGNLALVTVSPQGLKLHSKVQLLSSKARTVPTLVESKL